MGTPLRAIESARSPPATRVLVYGRAAHLPVAQQQEGLYHFNLGQ